MIVYLSPHLDDAALSNGGCIRLMKEICAKFILINIFTKSIWTSDDMQTLDETTVSNIRRLEDMEYCKELCLKSFYMGMKDSSLRGYDAISEVVRQLVRDNFYLEVRKQLLNLLNTLTYDYIFVPLGLGGHIDHLIVFDILTKTNQKNNVIYYEDIPYALNYTKENIADIVLLKGLHNYVKLDVTIQGLFDLKIKDILKYKSQIEEGLLDKITEYTYGHNSFQAIERLWVSS